ncbi:mannitol dehydrogenase family protein [Solimonas sp. SE-A11]|uniref:mannitol dehydrogenase family protein n=1 Tax=Solimonas sp. SE-A11 TaxID=3054954 RepID=UPI00259CC1F3|nr:mannitol dehydrogenase family protein [Solimonas sp. SE-A11]MDM4769823.1 mannitol dehydrogenase family protein [Solimonas sp. SE-A11]
MSAGLPLRNATLERVAQITVDGAAVDTPRYARQMSQRICHLGVGGFHRAHQALVLHRLLQQGLADGWGICGIGLRAADRPMHQALQAQDGLYSLWELEGNQRRVTVVGSIMDHLDASDDSRAAVALLADANTFIVSLTVTEAGYCLDAAGALDTLHPDIIHDLVQPARPRSAPGLLVAALSARRAAGIGGFTAMSCDNLVGNGHRLQAAVLGLAARLDPALAQWIGAEASFPCSMVDRITPAADPARSARLCADWGVDDRIPVVCEPWLQWVMEDRFIAGRPPFEQDGVVFSDAVERYEDMKVGLLNGGHSALSHLGLLLGYTRVHEALADPLVRDWHLGYMQEVAATLQPLGGVDYRAYQASLAQRFANAAIEDRLLRLAMDSSTKFPQVLLPPTIRRLQAGQPIDHLATAIALWIVYLDALAQDAAQRREYVDHDRDGLIALAVAAVASRQADTFLASKLSLPPTLATPFADAVTQQLRSLLQCTPRDHIRSLAQ